MKLKYAILTSFLSAVALYSSAVCQPECRNKQDANNRIEVLRKNYISQALNLSIEEAARFFPVYEAYDNELGNLMHNYKSANGTMSILEYRQQLSNIRKKYCPQFETVLGAKKFNEYLAKKCI